ncbi:hypothetical protein BT67DRAFT_18278 [Trichocladium antarcticum]|uniref:Uncharacterized protein n=1 Tax=Trichocladium antarcticum TaxID=1450529 RepID=A0AAN6UTL4_9PEZI|nr:hypothetical protein BT67DRAFT_18278 [Trichocladium antarcticum]
MRPPAGWGWPAADRGLFEAAMMTPTSNRHHHLGAGSSRDLGRCPQSRGLVDDTRQTIKSAIGCMLPPPGCNASQGRSSQWSSDTIRPADTASGWMPAQLSSTQETANPAGTLLRSLTGTSTYAASAFSDPRRCTKTTAFQLTSQRQPLFGQHRNKNRLIIDWPALMYLACRAPDLLALWGYPTI